MFGSLQATCWGVVDAPLRIHLHLYVSLAPEQCYKQQCVSVSADHTSGFHISVHHKTCYLLEAPRLVMSTVLPQLLESMKLWCCIG